jgi:isopentenyl diphosphate isomerase/L-lactate dehydrogenase-like FMN-dependent dehydrogenase
MKSIPAILAALALSAVVYAEDKPAAPAAPADATAPAAATPTPKPRKPAEEVFKKLDTNGDGVLSLEEYKASPQAQKDPAKAEERYKKMDKTGDGKVTLEEFKAAYEAHGKKNK